MGQESKLAEKIKSNGFIVTAEYLPRASTDGTVVEEATPCFNSILTAVNVADNPHGPVMSSLAGSVALARSGVEPVYQIVTRDRNRIALQSDLLGAAALGIKNVLCLSGYHQALTGCPESANVYDIDSIQLIAAVNKMNAEKILMDGKAIDGEFSMAMGAVANPDMTPMELNVIKLAKKVTAGASFIQTQAVFDTDVFKGWIDEIEKDGITEKAAVLAGVLPLESLAEAETLREKYTDYRGIDKVIDRLKSAGDAEAQKKEGMAVCVETIKEIREIKGVRGIHILSGGKEALVPEIIKSAGL